MVSALVIELDPVNPPLRLGDWLTEAGARLTLCRPHDGDEIPDAATGFDALICLGGRYNIYDEAAPYLTDMRGLFAAAVAAGTPTLAIGLGAQLLAAATGGRVERREGGWRLGAALAAKRDVTEQDLLLGMVPITPDVMQFHRDTITLLPGGSVLLLSSPGDAVEAFRVGSAAWGLQFHIETTAADLRGWLADPRWGIDDAQAHAAERAFGPALDETEELMSGSWRAVAHRFVQLADEGIPQTPTGRAAPRLPLISGN